MVYQCLFLFIFYNIEGERDAIIETNLSADKGDVLGSLHFRLLNNKEGFDYE